jgi:hypothetical protein
VIGWPEAVCVRDASGVTTTGVPPLSSARATVADSAAASSSVDAKIFRMIVPSSCAALRSEHQCASFSPAGRKTSGQTDTQAAAWPKMKSQEVLVHW